MWSSIRSLSGVVAKWLLRDQVPYCASCGRKMSAAQIEPLLTMRVDVVTFTCKSCAAEEKRVLRRKTPKR